jgi:hypothetical protein
MRRYFSRNHRNLQTPGVKEVEIITINGTVLVHAHSLSPLST